MDFHPPAADEPDTLASLQLLFSQIDSESRAQEVVNKAKDLSREETQLLVDALSTCLDKDNAFTRSQAYICLALVKIASATNVVSRNRTIKFENMTPSAGDDESLGIFTVTGQTPCQVKVVRRSQDDSSTNCSEELIRWAHLMHPNILPLYATFFKDNNLGFVSPCLPEISICDRARQLQKEQRIPLILNVANGLSYLHRLNIVHGGLTPEAVLISSEGRALIAGLDATSNVEECDRLPTRYSAPEIFQDENTRPTKAIDIWSFACFSYEVISGKAPFFQILKDTWISTAIVRGDKPLRPGREGVDGDEIEGSTHTVPRSCTVKGVQFDPTAPIAEGPHAKAYKGRGLNIRVNVVIDSFATTVWWSSWSNSSHPNILPFYGMFHEIFNEAPRICVISPLLENGNLRNYAPTLPQKSRLSLISDVINALVYIKKTWDMFVGTLDGQGILISNDGRAMVASFGLQLVFAGGECLSAYKLYWKRFEAPLSRYRHGPKDSVWSFGCVCYEVLTRKAPYYQYSGDHEVVTDNSQAELPRRPDRSDNDIDELDDKAWDLITKCCAQNPDDQASLSQIQEMVANLGIEDNRPAAKPLVELLRDPLLKLIKNRTKDVAEMVAELESNDVRPVVDFLDQALKDQLSISDERNRVLAILSRITSATHIFPQRYELNGVKYRFEPVAEGGFGSVHQGVDPSMCVKVMKRLDPNALTPWVKELILWAHSSHPNVLPFYGVFVQGGKGSPQTCLVSPFMKNGNLRDYAPRLSQKSRLPLISDVVHGLHYLHELGVVHGDLKGQNILISDEGRGLITDFGASHITTATAASGTLSATTLRFTAPEMLLGDKKPSKEFDIWSVGCLFYEVLSRKEPYYEYKYEVQIVAALSRKQPPMRPGTSTDNAEEKDDWDDDFDQDWDTIDDQAWNLILKCCIPEPENRPNMATVKELVVDLKIWDDRPTAKTIPGAEILKHRSEPKIDLVRVEELLDQLQSKLDARPESASPTTSVTSP
ncbi:Ribosomal protein S6 kinase alpha-5 [Leucoagaricus sp. SymC.cos]|nr:Ribosomal protein S6 kinase alpha-5 [Leucoagaricus sp. SymC.cos]